MTDIDLRARAREAAEGSDSVGPIEVASFIEGFLAHAAQQPTREQVAEVLCAQWFAPSWEQATSGAQSQCLRVADRALALFDGADRCPPVPTDRRREQ